MVENCPEAAVPELGTGTPEAMVLPLTVMVTGVDMSDVYAVTAHFWVVALQESRSGPGPIQIETGPVAAVAVPVESPAAAAAIATPIAA
ncbi:hypothetical protein GCM10027262_08540 [Nocardia tengchongensis]